MSVTTTLGEARLDYELHGFTLSISGADGPVSRALSRRLRRYRRPSAETSCDIRVSIVQRRLTAPDGACRDVYDTRRGSVRYFPECDTLYAELGGCDLRLAPADGLLELGAAEWTPAHIHTAAHTMMTLSLMEIYKRRALFPLHAACLAKGRRGLILAGTSGAGKSTLAVAVALAGLGYLSDDLVFLRSPGASEPLEACGFADTIGLTDRSFELLGLDVDGPLPPGFPKRLLDPADLSVGPIEESVIPRVVVFPEATGAADSHLTALPAREAWMRLLPDVLLTEPAATQAHLDTLGRLTEQVQCYRMTTGHDVRGAAEKIGALL